MADLVKKRCRNVATHLQIGTPVSVAGDFFFADQPVVPRITGVVQEAINKAGKVKVKWDEDNTISSVDHFELMDFQVGQRWSSRICDIFYEFDFFFSLRSYLVWEIAAKTKKILVVGNFFKIPSKKERNSKNIFVANYSWLKCVQILRLISMRLTVPLQLLSLISRDLFAPRRRNFIFIFVVYLTSHFLCQSCG